MNDRDHTSNEADEGCDGQSDGHGVVRDKEYGDELAQQSISRDPNQPYSFVTRTVKLARLKGTAAQSKDKVRCQWTS